MPPLPSRCDAAALSVHAEEAALRAEVRRTESLLRKQRCQQIKERFLSAQVRLRASSGLTPTLVPSQPADAQTGGTGTVSAGHAPAGAVALVDLQPDLAAGLSVAELNAARSALELPTVRVEAGALALEALASETTEPVLALLVVDGLILREAPLAGGRSTQLYGPGDVLNPRPDQTGALAAVSAPAAATLAVLENRLLAAMQRWPRLTAGFFAQAMQQIDRAGQLQAIAQLSRAEDRLMALFWHLAGRWGRVGADGVLIDLALTHETIGRLIRAPRPRVRLALGRLAEQGLLRREPAGGWLLPTESRPRVGSSEDSAAVA